MNDDEGIREVFWPPTGYLFKEVSLSPVFCKPKLIPLKSVTLEKLERMQADALEKLKQMEEEEQKRQNEEAAQQRVCLCEFLLIKNVQKKRNCLAGLSCRKLNNKK
jgi:BBSome-interacting protein 1